MTTMLRYHAHALIERLRHWYDGRRAARRMARMLRGHGFTETAPGVWDKPGTISTGSDQHGL